MLEVNQWNYYKKLQKLVNSEAKILNKTNNLMKEIPIVIRKIYDHLIEIQKKNPENYKNIKYKILDNERFLFYL